MSWIVKHKPIKNEELLLSQENFNKINNWFIEFKEKKNKTNCLFLYGGSGTGKTICAHTFLKNYNYNIIEFNSSDITKKNIFTNTLNDVLHKKNILNMFKKNHKETAIIMDEIDCINLNDKYIFNELINFIFPKKLYRYIKYTPFIIISNKIDKKQKNIIEKSLFIELKLTSSEKLLSLSLKILKKENVEYSDKEIYKLINISNNDIRQLIINLEYYKNKKETNQINELNILNKKNIEIEEYSYIKYIFNNYNKKNNFIIENKNIQNMIFYENFINFILKNKQNKKELILNIYKNFSDSDIFDIFIYKNHYWDLLNYNSYYKLFVNSYILNSSKTINSLDIELNYSSLLNKGSLEFINLKLISIFFKNIFNHTKSLHIHDIIILLKYIYDNDIHLLNKYDITKKDIKKTLKFIG